MKNDDGSVFRFRQCAKDAGIIDEMTMHDNGEWVDYEDYQELEAEIAKLKEQLAEEKKESAKWYAESCRSMDWYIETITAERQRSWDLAERTEFSERHHEEVMNTFEMVMSIRDKYREEQTKYISHLQKRVSEKDAEIERINKLVHGICDLCVHEKEPSDFRPCRECMASLTDSNWKLKEGIG